MNVFTAIMKFIKGEFGGFRFDSIRHSSNLGPLRYETVADGNRNMHEDMRHIGVDMRNSLKSLSSDGTEN